MATVLSAVLWYILTRDYAFTRIPMPGIELIGGTGSKAHNLSKAIKTDSSTKADRVLLTLLPRRAPTYASPKVPAVSTKPTPQQISQRASLIARFRQLWTALEAYHLLGSFAPSLAAASPSLIRTLMCTLSAHSLDEVEQAVIAVAQCNASKEAVTGEETGRARRRHRTVACALGPSSDGTHGIETSSLGSMVEGQGWCKWADVKICSRTGWAWSSAFRESLIG